ncbi:65-kDa microtubule-associated protein 3 [Zea mays]|uniref:65-kDa microtubule-associated protein 3 n=1 Tax=Zea mays TaxID=4577 RepID=A0A1D6K8W8_MAIZE|nr:65-kDa microtubule-associated protein 3 [Zea mays]
MHSGMKTECFSSDSISNLFSFKWQSNQKLQGLREEMNAIVPYLEEMRKKKVERWDQFVDVIEQIKKVASEIRPADFVPFRIPMDQSDLSLRKLEELTKELQSLQKEKSDRLKQVMEHLNTLHSLCEVLGVDFKQIVNELQDLASSMLELWNLMDTPLEEQQMFQNVTCNIAASEHEITEPNTLSIDFLSYVESEVLRLEQHKASKMKDLVLKKKTELEEHRRRAHLIGEEGYAAKFSDEAIEAGKDHILLDDTIIKTIETAPNNELKKAKEIIQRIRRRELYKAGKKLLLITNSDFHYTNKMMNHAFSRFLPNDVGWRDLFEMVIVSTRKPEFFQLSHPLYEVVTDDGLMHPCFKVNSFPVLQPVFCSPKDKLEHFKNITAQDIVCSQKSSEVLLKEEDVAVSNVKIDLTRGKDNPLERFLIFEWYLVLLLICLKH